MAPRTSQKAFCSSLEMPITFMAACSLLNCWVAFCFSSGCKSNRSHQCGSLALTPCNQMVQATP